MNLVTASSQSWVGRAVLEEAFEDFDQVFGFGEVAVEGDAVAW